MINKEVILDSTGGIRKDFAKRGIPQYSNNYVHVNFLIPQDVFAELDNYTVQVAASITAQSQTTVLPTLYAFASKTLKIDDINYIKYSVVLSSIYTEKRGALKLSPSVYEVRQTTVDTQLTTQLINRKAYVYTQLDVVESVDATYDNSLDNPTMAVALSNAIDSKHISDIDENGASIAEIAYNVATDYSTPYYNGWILMNKAKKQMFIPYIGTDDEENLFYLDYKNGIMYDITNITASGSTPISYSCDIKQLNFSKEEVETLLSDKLEDVAYADNYFTKTYHNNVTNEDTTENIVHVDTLADDMGFTAHKNNTENPHSVTATQVGLGNVSNYTISNAYNSDSATSYASSKAVYDGLATKADLDAFQTLQSTVNQLITILGDPEGEDADNIVNKLTEVIQVFSDYEESNGSIITLLNTKADVTTVSTLSGSVDALATRVSNIEEAGAGLIILKPEGANQALLTLTPSEFVANTGENALDYPYKTTLTSSAFVGAQDFSVVFNEEDGGLFEPICTLNNQTGELTLYCSELPTENIIIVKIRLIFSLASINSLILTQNSQIATNTANITDIYSQLNNKQNISNLVTSWSSTTSDSKYPSEKLVKDSLDAKGTLVDTFTNNVNDDTKYPSAKLVDTIKQDKTNIVKSTDNSGAGWNTTTSDAKYPSEKLVKDSLDAKGTKVTSFGSTTSDSNYPSEKLVKDNLDLKQDKSSLVTSFQTTPDNTHYPSEKLVKDNLDTKQSNALVTNFNNADNTHYPSAKVVKDSLDAKLNESAKATTWVNTTIDDGYVPSAKLVKNSLDGKMANAITVENPSTNSNFTITYPSLVTGKMYAVIGAIKISAIAGSDTHETTLSNTVFKIKSTSTSGSSSLNTKTASVDYCRFLVYNNEWTQSSGNLTASGTTYNSKVEYTLYGALIPLD